MFDFFRRKKASLSAYPTTRPYPSPTGGRRRRPIPDTIQRYYIPISVLEATDRVMRRFGKEKRECYVWWGGYFTGEGDGQVLTAIWPETRTDFGRIHLGTRDLTKLHNQLRATDQVLLIELHTHPPGAGGQNRVDADHPAATYRGFVSAVVPDFGFPRFYDLRWAYWYEYLGSRNWRELNESEIAKRFVVEESFIPVG